ncbi:hypothetical protein [Streptomyces sp. NPDC020965]|uniref:hypothetical protein n=1 Tax=Streptomyces sp. NPDC020965 TaxID=3365105 RepID=UPI00378CB524
METVDEVDAPGVITQQRRSTAPSPVSTCFASVPAQPRASATSANAAVFACDCFRNAATATNPATTAKPTAANPAVSDAFNPP